MSDQQAVGAILGYFAVIGIISLAILIFMLFCFWRIFARAGYSGWMCLLALIPGVGTLIVVLVLAFGEWPALRELNDLRQRLGMRGPQYPGAPPFPGGPQYPNSNPSGPQFPGSNPSYPGGSPYGGPNNPPYPPR